MDIDTQICYSSRCCQITITRDLNEGDTLVKKLTNCKMNNLDNNKKLEVTMKMVGNPNHNWYGERLFLDGHTLCEDHVKFPDQPTIPKPLEVHYNCPLGKWMYGNDKITYSCVRN